LYTVVLTSDSVTHYVFYWLRVDGVLYVYVSLLAGLSTILSCYMYGWYFQTCTVEFLSHVSKILFEPVVSTCRSEFDVHVIVHRDKFCIIKPTRCTNFSILFWNETLHVSDSSSVHHEKYFAVHTAIRHTGLWTACKLSANRYDVYYGCVYSEILLMMDRGTVWNM
jgi:hypothetical protein